MNPLFSHPATASVLLMFEINGDDIAQLNDEDLRSLVGLLCEAELRRRALPLAAVTWGGNQTAKDGGLDVHVELVAAATIDGFIPKPHTGFQVKKPDMPRGAIIDEMRPKGVLRPIIVELIRTSGAYVIVSASGSTSSSALTSRRQAMTEALEGLPDSHRLTVDFYDRNRIANEKQVVYLLVAVRKLMDRDHYEDPILRTFSNWVVHTSLENRADGSTFILREFDHFVTELYERKTKSNQLTHISLGAFRESLTRFCEHFALTAKFLTDLGEWKRFSSLYCSIVSECPIVFTASRMKLKYIKQIELTRISPGIVVKEWPIVHWRLTFLDGRVENWGFHVG